MALCNGSSVEVYLTECLHDNFENEAQYQLFFYTVYTRTYKRVLHAILFSTAYDIFLPFKSLPFFTESHTGYYVKEAEEQGENGRFLWTGSAENLHIQYITDDVQNIVTGSVSGVELELRSSSGPKT
jgi:hypothetical protein